MLRVALLFLMLPIAGFAAGSDTTKPPAAPVCEMGQVWNPPTQSCINAYRPELNDGLRYVALRAYVYAGQKDHAMMVLDAMSDQNSDAVLTYRGFVARSTGDMTRAMTWYEAALRANPDNLLARSYMGQGLVAAGDLVAALRQYREILARGGAGSWAEISLAAAIKSGSTFAY